MYHRAVWHAAVAVPRVVQARAQLHQLEGNPALLRRHGDCGWHRADRRRPLAPREIPGPAGDPRPLGRSQDRRLRLGVHRLRPALPRLGASRPDDSAPGATPRLAQTESDPGKTRRREHRITSSPSVVDTGTFFSVGRKDQRRRIESAAGAACPTADDEDC